VGGNSSHFYKGEKGEEGEGEREIRRLESAGKKGESGNQKKWGGCFSERERDSKISLWEKLLFFIKRGKGKEGSRKEEERKKGEEPRRSPNEKKDDPHFHWGKSNSLIKRFPCNVRRKKPRNV